MKFSKQNFFLYICNCSHVTSTYTHTHSLLAIQLPVMGTLGDEYKLWSFAPCSVLQPLLLHYYRFVQFTCLIAHPEYISVIDMNHSTGENVCSVCTYCGNAISQTACLWHVMCSTTSNVCKSIVKISFRTVPTNNVVFCSCRDVGVQSTIVDFNCVITKEHGWLDDALLCNLYVFCY